LMEPLFLLPFAVIALASIKDNPSFL
jgi:hypothetical protein